MKPTPELAQHHEIEPPRVDQFAFRQAWRIKTRLDRLLFDGGITPAEWLAAVRFRMVWHRAFVSLWPSPRYDVPAGAGAVDPTTGTRLDALAEIRELREYLGDMVCDLLELCVIDDISWAALGRRLKIDPKTARAWTLFALKALAIRRSLIAIARSSATSVDSSMPPSSMPTVAGFPSVNRPAPWTSRSGYCATSARRDSAAGPTASSSRTASNAPTER
jgi:hypothetical protein